MSQGSTEPLIRWLSEPECQDAAVAGGKGAALARLTAQFQVPPGFCVLARPRASGSRRADAIRQAYAQLGALTGYDAPRVAVRSSAVGEDGTTASFAGQLETRLGIAGAEAVVAAVDDVLESAASARVGHYLRERALRPERAESLDTAVVIQTLIPADVAIVGFSIDPVKPDPDHLVVHATLGLGESLVSGLVTPDMYTIRRRDLEIVSNRVGDKHLMIVPTATGTRTVSVPRPIAARPSATPGEVLEVAKLLLALEQQHQHPVDVEAAFWNQTLYLLQCRPITTVGGTGHMVGGG